MSSKRRTYSWDFKAEVLAVYEVDGPAAAAQLYGVPRRTLQGWASRVGVSTAAMSKTTTDNANARNEARRVELRGLLMETAVSLLKRVDQPHIDFKPGGALGPVEVTFPVAPAGACQNYATSVGILLDKYRLEAGESTSREEVRHDYADRSDEDLIREAEAILRDATH
jgi:transposase-like protein